MTSQVDSLSIDQLKDVAKKYEKLVKNLQERHTEVIRQFQYKVNGVYLYQKAVPNEIKLEKRIYEVLLESVGERYE